MLFSTVIFGWIGILIFLLILFNFKKMAKNNEYALMHLMQAIMYAMWLPLPLVLYQLLDSDILFVGSVFGSVYLILLVAGMALQTGHLAFISKHNEDKKISDSQANYMMATLSHPYEGFVNVFKCLWAIFLGLSFWQKGEGIMAMIMFLFGLFIIYYLIIILDASLVKRVTLFKKIKPNTVLVNLETFLFFLTLIIYITFIFGS
ncbi:hypothetical protein [Facklamia sp. 7083-14-GEN3]|uniref:hypothetical protein n=1 Tax=Facklamia sp. 7083-14-GEN3 TaxID=2973478 RepID=UPI00215D0755|nr:hypothetical protein [Facklamia sp. 7083-14-GEN3]MCR8968433.1 hypothetical protein [Facklamia sp. 7083-14-GEN3]